MNGLDIPKSLGKSFSVYNKSTPSTNARQCAWCTCSEEDPIAKHDDWCDKKIISKISDKSINKKISKNLVTTLETKIKDLRAQLAEYESTLLLIAAPKRPDGTFNRDRESCRVLANNILKVYSASAQDHRHLPQ
jgi:hypothetical protein